MKAFLRAALTNIDRAYRSDYNPDERKSEVVRKLMLRVAAQYPHSDPTEAIITKSEIAVNVEMGASRWLTVCGSIVGETQVKTQARAKVQPGPGTVVTSSDTGGANVHGQHHRE